MALVTVLSPLDTRMEMVERFFTVPPLLVIPSVTVPLFSRVPPLSTVIPPVKATFSLMVSCEPSGTVNVWPSSSVKFSLMVWSPYTVPALSWKMMPLQSEVSLGPMAAPLEPEDALPPVA